MSIYPWEWTEKPWARLHVDYAGSDCYDKKMFLIVVDSFLAWIVIKPIANATSEEAFEKVCIMFANFGLPE